MELCLAWQRRNPGVPNFGAAATPINHGAAYDRQAFSDPPPRATLAAVLRPMKRPQPACDSQRPSGRSILVSTPVMARSLPRTGLAQPRGGVSTTSLPPTWFCQPRTGSGCAVGALVGALAGRGVRQRDWRHVLAHVPSTSGARADAVDTAWRATRARPMPSCLALHAPHSSAASPRLVMEPGS
ncbi:uncharacterized protein TrAtP1_003682 [Trichoderma atroviride]|nr:hypothetical protein TrAtP1_003682 [Trichoderma atroviride]